MSQRNQGSMQSDCYGMTRWLILHAAGRLPEPLSSRLEEEWLADLESRSSALSRLRFGLGCCWATVVIAGDYPRSAVPAASSASAARGIVRLADRNFGYFSARSGTIFLVAGLHAALFYGLITTLSRTPVSATPPDLQNQVVKPLPPEKVPPLLLPGMKMLMVPTLVVDPPRKLVIEDDEVSARVLDKSPDPSPPPPPESRPHVVQQVGGGPGAGFPDTADFYPSYSIRIEEEGMSTVRVCVDPRGKLTSEPTIAKSSGSARLDEGALKLARAGSGHYRATTEDGQPVNSCYPVGIRFQLKR